jgi:hypothetical protein
MKKEYPDLFWRQRKLFLNDIKHGICERTTICAHITHGQKKESTHDGITLLKHENKPDSQCPVGTPAISKLFWGLSN